MGQRLGQHFLVDKKWVRLIVDALELKSGETVIEIGPGRGALTYELGLRIKEVGGTLAAIEKDKKLAEDLRLKTQSFNYIKVISGDALKFLPFLISSYKLKAEDYKITGNIPYYITGRLLRVLSELDLPPKRTILMLQREVAERVSAMPPKMNLLAASVQIWAEPKVIGYVPRTAFRPPPKISSAVLLLKKRIVNDKSRITENYYALVRALFKQPRKTILNNLLSGFFMEREQIAALVTRAGMDPLARPQTLDIFEIKKLSALLYNEGA